MNLSSEKVEYFCEIIKKWAQKNLREFPWRNTSNPYKVLIAEIMLQQTDTNKVKQVYNDFLEEFSNVEELADASYEDINKYISKIGLSYRTERLLNIASVIKARWNGQVPTNPTDLKSLPGVGDYIANSVGAISGDYSVPAVDSNVIRIIQRFFGVESKKNRPRNDPKIWNSSKKLLPDETEKVKIWNWALLDFGAIVCTYYNPKCYECPVIRKCSFFESFLKSECDKNE